MVEYPFDTIKVHLQTQKTENPYGIRGTLNCISSIYKRQGLRGFFKGLSAPLLGSMIENSVLFIAYNQIQYQIRSHYQMHASDPLSLRQLCLSGALSGAAVSFVLTPVELIKCQLQVLNTGHSSPFSLLFHTLRTRGVSGLYRGHLGTLLREVAGGAAWFGVYEAVVRSYLDASPGLTKEDLSPLALMGAGALAGMSYNAALFPADVIKSRQQTFTEATSFVKVARELYRVEGYRGFYRGFGITIARSAPTSGVIFLSYEILRRNLVVEW